MSRSRLPFPARPRTAWSQAGDEPPLEEALADPIVLLLMRSDGVTPARLRDFVAQARLRRHENLHRRCAA
jgi:hypothetical protein